MGHVSQLFGSSTKPSAAAWQTISSGRGWTSSQTARLISRRLLAPRSFVKPTRASSTVQGLPKLRRTRPYSGPIPFAVYREARRSLHCAAAGDDWMSEIFPRSQVQRLSGRRLPHVAGVGQQCAAARRRLKDNTPCSGVLTLAGSRTSKKNLVTMSQTPITRFLFGTAQKNTPKPPQNCVPQCVSTLFENVSHHLVV